MMMEDLIKREKLFEHIKAVCLEGDGGALITSEDFLKMAINDIPSAEKQGEWIYCEDNGQDGYRCSECGLFVPWCYDYHDSNFILDYQVCPYCLARMKGADDAASD